MQPSSKAGQGHATAAAVDTAGSAAADGAAGATTADAAAAVADNADGDAAAVSDLWLLSPRFPGPAIDTVRRKLPTLAALRLVSRAARDDLVDGRATRARRRWADAPFEALASAAPRLRSIQCIDADAARLGFWYGLRASQCAALAGALEALPASGAAALRELRVGPIIFKVSFVTGGHKADTRAEALCALARLASAIGRLTGLARLEFTIEGGWHGSNDGAPELFRAAGRLPALTRLRANIVGPPREALLEWLPVASLARLQTIELSLDTTSQMLPALLAAPLPRLRDLSFCNSEHARSSRLPPAPWRAAWMAQLTRLALTCREDVLRHISRALPPGCLPLVRALKVEADLSCVDVAELRALFAACDAAALHTLALTSARGAAVAAVAAALPALRALECKRCQFWTPQAMGHPNETEHERCDAGWRALLGAPLAPLTRLELSCACPEGGRVNSRFAELLAAGWMQSLRQLSLSMEEDDPRATPRGAPALRVLQGLAALTALSALRLNVRRLDAAAIERAAAEGWAEGWAPRLEAFEIRDTAGFVPSALRMGAGAMRALLRLPFSGRLGRLVIDTVGEVTQQELAAFSAACAAALPRLTALEFLAGRSAGGE